MFVCYSDETEAPWVSGKCMRYNPDTDEFDSKTGVYGCGKVFPWGAIEIARISDEVPEDSREEIELLITNAPVLRDNLKIAMDALNSVIEYLGPKAPDCLECEGCRHEWNAAIESVLEAIKNMKDLET